MKIAIVLHGHVRTWEFCKENIVTTINQIYKDFDVDWFIGFWKSNTVYDAVDYLKLKNQNVVVSEIYDQSNTLFSQRSESYGYSSSNNLGRWYIRQKLGIQRRYLEIKNNKKYEIVVYLRPDICFYKLSDTGGKAYNHFYKVLQDNELWRSRYQLQAGGDYTDFWYFNQAIREIGMDDMFTVTGSLTSDIFDHCYTEYNDSTSLSETYKLGFGDTHLPTATYFMQHSITAPHNGDTLKGKYCPVIIRPHVTRELYDQLVSSSPQHVYTNEWKNFSRGEQIDYCLKSNIDLQEYGL
jgi:hypothetical protein